MGFFDFIGDALGAIASPFTAVIDAGTKLLGLPPVVGDALKIAVGAATGDFVTLMQGSTQLLKDLAGQRGGDRVRAAEGRGLRRHGRLGTRIARASATDDDLAAMDPAVARRAGGGDRSIVGAEDPEERQALDTLARNFDAMNRDHGLFGAFGDKVITEKELRETAEDPDAPVDLKRAARYVLDHPDLMERLSRSRDGGDQGIARSDIDRSRRRTGRASRVRPAGARTARSANDELSALQTLLAALRRSERPDQRDHPSGQGAEPGGDRRGGERRETPRRRSSARSATCSTTPAVLDRLSRSQGAGREGISRSDLQIGIEDARRGASTTVTPKTSSDRRAEGDPSSPSGTTGDDEVVSSSSSRSTDPSIKDILNDKSLSVEEKIEMILMVLENRIDDQMLSVTQQLDQNDDKKSDKDDRKKVAQLDKVDRDLNFKMERLMKRKEQLSNLLSTMEMKFASMAQTAIANMGR